MRTGGRAARGRSLSTPDGSEFDAIAAEYDRVRPSYPAALVDAACDRARLSRGSRVLEIGCGTGQLTEMLVARGLAVDAVDPGAQMIDIARRRVGGAAQFHVGRFEDVDLPPETFAAVFSATAFHWIDPAVGWSKVAGLLEPAGVLALLQTGLQRRLVREFDRSVWRSVLTEEAAWPATDPFDVWREAEARLGDVSALWGWLVRHDLQNHEAAALFDEVRLLTVPLPVQDTAESYLALVASTSTYLVLDPAERMILDRSVRALFAAAGGKDRWVDHAVLVTTRRCTGR
jgi:SAM-dependent methyltransferase